MPIFSHSAPRRSAPLTTRHAASGLNHCLYRAGMQFSDYVATCTQMLEKCHQQLRSPNLATVVAGNAPFSLAASRATLAAYPNRPKRGIVLTHGLTDSPYFMRPLGDFFAEQGFVVMAILLPGHGTQPGDLLSVQRDEWAQTLACAVASLAIEVDEIYLGGLSTGATLSIQHSLQDPRIRGLFLFSPALKITPRAALAKFHRLTSWLLARSAWVDIQVDRDPYKYESLTKNAVAQTYALTQSVQRQLSQQPLSVPIFTALSNDDATVNSAATLDWLAHTPHPNNHTVLYATHDLKLAQKNIECVLMRDGAQRILSSAHTAIVLPDDDAHYGATGDYANCVHYFPDQQARYRACINPATSTYRGEINTENLQRGVLRRLMSNPHFSELTISLQQFIARLP